MIDDLSKANPDFVAFYTSIDDDLFPKIAEHLNATIRKYARIRFSDSSVLLEDALKSLFDFCSSTTGRVVPLDASEKPNTNLVKSWIKGTRPSSAFLIEVYYTLHCVKWGKSVAETVDRKIFGKTFLEQFGHPVPGGYEREASSRYQAEISNIPADVKDVLAENFSEIAEGQNRLLEMLTQALSEPNALSVNARLRSFHEGDEISYDQLCCLLQEILEREIDPKDLDQAITQAKDAFIKLRDQLAKAKFSEPEFERMHDRAKDLFEAGKFEHAQRVFDDLIELISFQRAASEKETLRLKHQEAEVLVESAQLAEARSDLSGAAAKLIKAIGILGGPSSGDPRVPFLIILAAEMYVRESRWTDNISNLHEATSLLSPIADGGLRTRNRKCIARSKYLLASCFDQMSMFDTPKMAKYNAKMANKYYWKSNIELDSLNDHEVLWDSLYRHAAFSARIAEFSGLPIGQFYYIQASILYSISLENNNILDFHYKSACVNRDMGILYMSFSNRWFPFSKKRLLNEAINFLDKSILYFKPSKNWREFSIAFSYRAISKLELAIHSSKKSRVALLEEASSDLRTSLERSLEEDGASIISMLAKSLGFSLIMSAYYSSGSVRKDKISEANRAFKLAHQILDQDASEGYMSANIYIYQAQAWGIGGTCASSLEDVRDALRKSMRAYDAALNRLDSKFHGRVYRFVRIERAKVRAFLYIFDACAYVKSKIFRR